MTVKEKKMYLGKYKRVKYNIARINLEIENIETAASMPSAKIGDGMPHAHNKTDLSDYMVRKEKAITKLLKAKHEGEILLISITEAINNLDDDTEKDILYLRYIQLMKWQDIEDYIGYSHKHTFRIHDVALKHLELT